MWERMTSNNGMTTERLKVFGGWIVRTLYVGVGTASGLAQTFVSDTEHRWKLEKLKK